jgi:SAM-dependent methyltransferase
MLPNRLFKASELETDVYRSFAAYHNCHLPFEPLGMRTWELWAAVEGLQLNANSIILDVGSFYSSTPFLLASYESLVVAMDNYQWPEERQIPGYQLTVNQWQDLCLKNRILPLRGDARQLQMFGNKTFDFVFCISAIEHIQDFEFAIAEMRRIGKTVSITTDCCPAGTPYENYGRYFSFRDLQRHFDPKIDTSNYDMLTGDRTLAVIRYG